MKALMDAGTCRPVQSPAPETWPSGRRHSPAKGAYGPKPVSRVRIPASPPVKQSLFIQKYPQLGLDGESLLINQRDRLANGTRFYPFQSRSPVVRRVVRWADNFRCVAPVWPHLRGETYSRRLNMALTPLESKAALPKAKTYRLSLRWFAISRGPSVLLEGL